jgi:hypothetical protein
MWLRSHRALWLKEADPAEKAAITPAGPQI